MSMTIKLYKISDDDNVVHKTLSSEKSYTCTIKNEAEILGPEIQIQSGDNLSDYNYAYIERYGRYYFVKPSTVPNGLWKMKCRVDVLMSHRTELLKLKGTLQRSETVFNGYLNDPEYKALAYRKVVTKQFPHAMTSDCFYLMTVG